MQLLHLTQQGIAAILPPALAACNTSHVPGAESDNEGGMPYVMTIYRFVLEA